MKVRNGFVSNSSSSSFLVRANSTVEIAINMMNHWVKQFNEDSDNWEDFCLYNKNKFDIHIKEITDRNAPLLMPWTCNYETYIYHLKDNLYMVDTCNNHSFWNAEINIIKSGDSAYDLLEDDDYSDVNIDEKNIKFFDLSDGRNKTSKQEEAECGYAHEIQYIKNVSKLSDEELVIFFRANFKWYDILVEKTTVKNYHIITIIDEKTKTIMCKFKLADYWDIMDIENEKGIMSVFNFSMLNYFNLLLAFGYIKQKGE